MKTSILNLEGVKLIQKKTQKEINGGSRCGCGPTFTIPGTCLCYISV